MYRDLGDTSPWGEPVLSDSLCLPLTMFIGHRAPSWLRTRGQALSAGLPKTLARQRSCSSELSAPIPAPWVRPRGTLGWQRCSQVPPAPAHPRLSSTAPKWMSGSDETSRPWGIPIFLPCTLWCGRLTPPAPLHLPIKPFRFSKLAFSPNISSASLFRNRLSVFGRILFLMRALAMPVSRRLPKLQPESPPCSLLHQTLPP